MLLISAFGRQGQEDLYEFESAWSKQRIPDQLGLHSEILSQKPTNKQKPTTTTKTKHDGT